METSKAFYQEICAVSAAVQSWPAQPVTHTAGRVGVVLLSSGQCAVRCTSPSPSSGAQPFTRAQQADALEQEAAGGPGSLFLVPVPFVLQPLTACHCLCVTLAGLAAEGFAALLRGPVAQDAGLYPALTPLLLALCEAPPPPRQQSALGYELLCMLDVDAPAPTGWPPLVRQAVALIRERYGSLYGVEELADALGVSKSHLVRVFHQTMGVTPGRYLTDTRIEAARQLLARGHTLEVVAGLCGFSGANYLCKVFKRETGLTPVQYRDGLQPAADAQPLADAAEADLFL